MFAGFGTADGHQRALQGPAEGRRNGPLDRVRHAHPHGPRLRPPARARGGRARRGGHRRAGGRRGPLRGHRPGVGLDLDDDQRAGGDRPRDVRRGRGESGASPAADLGRTIQNDILKEYQAQKEYIFPPRPSVRLVTDVVPSRPPRCRGGTRCRSPATTSGRPGSTAAQELAFTLANGFAYVEAALAAGLDVDAFAPRLSFFFNCHVDFFEEIGKYRAARRILARWMRERYGAADERSPLCGSTRRPPASP